MIKRACEVHIPYIDKQENCISRIPVWHLVKPNIFLSIHEKVKKSSSLPIEQYNCAVECISSKWKHYLKIYTDGSKLEDGQTGAAFYVPIFKIGKNYRISPVSIMTAELVAIFQALEWVEEQLTTRLSLLVVILTDSLSALHAIRNMKRMSIIIEIREKLTHLANSGVEVNFEWIPSHCNLLGNEHVDGLAKKGALRQNIDVQVPRDKQDIINYMKHYYQEIWQIQWEGSSKGRFLFNIQSSVFKSVSMSHLNRQEEKIIHQLRMGKCNLNFYKYSIKKHENGLCYYCHECETIEHFLLFCKKHEKARQKMFNRIKRKMVKRRNVNLNDLLGNEDNFLIVVDFIKSTKRFSLL